MNEDTLVRRHRSPRKTADLKQQRSTVRIAESRVSSLDRDGIVARVRLECAEQGVPKKVEDPIVIIKVVTLAFEGFPTPSTSP